MKAILKLSPLFFIFLMTVVNVPELYSQQTVTLQQSPSVEQVENKFVCMITNKVFEEEQIPVTVNGMMYYGCCNMCVEKLNTKAENRYATDPISGKRVNKAEAVIGATPDRSIYYFESIENLKAFDPAEYQAENGPTSDQN